MHPASNETSNSITPANNNTKHLKNISKNSQKKNTRPITRRTRPRESKGEERDFWCNVPEKGTRLLSAKSLDGFTCLLDIALMPGNELSSYSTIENKLTQ